MSIIAELLMLLAVAVIAATIGYFVGHRGVKQMKVVSSQLQEERQKTEVLQEERTNLRRELLSLKEKASSQETIQGNKAVSKIEEEWRRKLNEVRIEAEVEKVKRVDELERELRRLKMEGRMKEELANDGDDSAVPEGVADGLTPRARQVCAKILEWEGLSAAELEKAANGLKAELGARSLMRVKFGKGSAAVRANEESALRVAVEDAEDFSLILAVGFADIGGDAALNQGIGNLRARNVADTIQSLAQRSQVVEAVYLGQTERFGAKVENRVVEVWELRR